MFFLIIIAVIGKLVIVELFDTRPFKFEQYISNEELERVLKKQCAIGSNIDKAVELLQKSGAKCLKYHMKKGNHSGFGMYCNYYTDFISLAPLTHYEIWLDANEKSEIIDIEVVAFFVTSITYMTHIRPI